MLKINPRQQCCTHLKAVNALLVDSAEFVWVVVHLTCIGIQWYWAEFRSVAVSCLLVMTGLVKSVALSCNLCKTTLVVPRLYTVLSIRDPMRKDILINSMKLCVWKREIFPLKRSTCNTLCI